MQRQRSINIFAQVRTDLFEGVMLSPISLKDEEIHIDE